MQQIKIAFIINPHSGTSDKKNLPDVIRENLSSDKFDITTVFTEYAGHGRILATQFKDDGFDAVVACGGDGTVNEVASSLTDSDVALGIIPFGSGNGLARHLGVPLDTVKAIRFINDFQTLSIDYGVINDYKFFCTCGTGFDAQVSWDFAHQGTRGFMTYVKVIFRDLWNMKPQKYVLTMADGTQLVEEAQMITFANASQYGNDAFIAPKASIKDGLMDIAIVRPFGLLSIPKFAYQIMGKKLDKNPNVSFYRTTSVKLQRPADGPFHFDGDPKQEGQSINISLVHAGLKVISKNAQ